MHIAVYPDTNTLSQEAAQFKLREPRDMRVVGMKPSRAASQ